jgi:hypothetical protein
MLEISITNYLKGVIIMTEERGFGGCGNQWIWIIIIIVLIICLCPGIFGVC